MALNPEHWKSTLQVNLYCLISNPLWWCKEATFRTFCHCLNASNLTVIQLGFQPFFAFFTLVVIVITKRDAAETLHSSATMPEALLGPLTMEFRINWRTVKSLTPTALSSCKNYTDGHGSKMTSVQVKWCLLALLRRYDTSLLRQLSLVLELRGQPVWKRQIGRQRLYKVPTSSTGTDTHQWNIQCLGQRHLNMQTEGDWDQTTFCQVI